MTANKDTQALPGPEKLEPAQRELLDKGAVLFNALARKMYPDHPVSIVRDTLPVHDTGRPFSTLSSPSPRRITSPLVPETTIAGEVVARQILEPTDPSYNLEKQQIDAL